MQETLHFSETKRRQSSCRAPGFQERLRKGLCIEARRIVVIPACSGVASAQGDRCLFSGRTDGQSHPSHVPHLSLSAPHSTGKGYRRGLATLVRGCPHEELLLFLKFPSDRAKFMHHSRYRGVWC
ncbi:hypothetical protein TcCL_Unassigned05024 [Trypanosoma cruzi]|nr:hypothetical protein TcCL_Unassigned05024 [Trypanosoma cruzi]